MSFLIGEYEDDEVVAVRGVAFTIKKDSFSYHNGHFLVENFPRDTREATRNMLMGLASSIGINVQTTEEHRYTKQEIVNVLQQYLQFLY
jgi:4-hydroxy-3-methylbut-2-enyl diphosphate reductase IspH